MSKFKVTGSGSENAKIVLISVKKCICISSTQHQNDQCDISRIIVKCILPAEAHTF